MAGSQVVGTVSVGEAQKDIYSRPRFSPALESFILGISDITQLISDVDRILLTTSIFRIFRTCPMIADTGKLCKVG